MQVKPRNEILSDIIKDATDQPTDWKAVFGHDPIRFSNDYYLFHPDVGVYLIKEYEKNPFYQIGVGGKITRHIDDDICCEISTFSGNFGIIQGDIHKIMSNIQRGTQPSDIIDAAFQGEDLGLTLPLRGNATIQNKSFKRLRSLELTHQKKIEKQFEKLATEERIYSSYD